MTAVDPRPPPPALSASASSYPQLALPSSSLLQLDVRGVLVHRGARARPLLDQHHPSSSTSASTRRSVGVDWTLPSALPLSLHGGASDGAAMAKKSFGTILKDAGKRALGAFDTVARARGWEGKRDGFDMTSRPPTATCFSETAGAPRSHHRHHHTTTTTTTAAAATTTTTTAATTTTTIKPVGDGGGGGAWGV